MGPRAGLEAPGRSQPGWPSPAGLWELGGVSREAETPREPGWRAFCCLACASVWAACTEALLPGTITGKPYGRGLRVDTCLRSPVNPESHFVSFFESNQQGHLRLRPGQGEEGQRAGTHISKTRT